MMKTFEPLTKKTTKKKKKRERRDRERNRRDRQKEGFEKVRSDSYMFLKNEIQLFERNWVGIEFHMKTCLIDRKESSRNQRNPKLLVKTYFSSSHFDRSKSKGHKFLKILEKKNLWNHLKTVFMIWHVCSWLQMIFKTKLYQISSIFSFFTPKNALNTSKSLTLEGHKT